MRTGCFGAATGRSCSPGSEYGGRSLRCARRPQAYRTDRKTGSGHRSEIPCVTEWRVLSPSAQLIVDPASGARGIISDLQIVAKALEYCAQPCQGWGRRFESPRPLQISAAAPWRRTSLGSGSRGLRGERGLGSRDAAVSANSISRRPRCGVPVRRWAETTSSGGWRSGETRDADRTRQPLHPSPRR